MCGIAGTVGCGSAEIVTAMTDAERHRGPDDWGLEWFEEGRCGLGHRRLSIIDLSPGGHQPQANDSGHLWITYNGEIYNYREVRRELEQSGQVFRTQSDTEVLVKAFETWGEACLDRLNGQFAFAIYDRRNRSLFAARDRLGIKPFYYWHGGESLVFASEIKAILASGLVKAEPDLLALHNPTRFQISPLTGFKGIFKLPPGHLLTFKDATLSVRPYWTIEPREDATITEAEALARLDDLLRSSVDLQMVADVPVGVLLSGGLDSSIISALMRERTSQPVHSFTIRFSEGDQAFERSGDDSAFARKVADKLGFTHHEFEIKPDIVDLLPRMVWHLDEPLADPAAINTYLISKAARDLGIVVLLNGVGGDEVFGGYRKQLACLKAEAYQALVPRPLQGMIRGALDRVPVATASRGLRVARWGKRFASFASLPQAERFLASDSSLSADQYEALFGPGASYRDTHFFKSQAPGMARTDLSYLTRMCLNDTRVFLPEHNLTYSDKASMAAGVEARPPLIDHRVVEFMFSLRPDFRIRGNTQKYLLKKLSERYLPSDVIYRPKAAFGSPLRAWMRGPLAPMVRDILSAPSVKARGLYDHHYVTEMIEKDSRGLEDHSLTIWVLLTTELWFRTFWPAGVSVSPVSASTL
jgi:asparagine synthase (glutamine-hydrolysing)